MAFGHLHVVFLTLPALFSLGLPGCWREECGVVCAAVSLQLKCSHPWDRTQSVRCQQTLEFNGHAVPENVIRALCQLVVNFSRNLS